MAKEKKKIEFITKFLHMISKKSNNFQQFLHAAADQNEKDL